VSGGGGADLMLPVEDERGRLTRLGGKAATDTAGGTTLAGSGSGDAGPAARSVLSHTDE